ncbi:MAG: aldo/keto reductase [Bacilli bacterium]|nr:aldo/keto reductase [Bacilli bacterium]
MEYRKWDKVNLKTSLLGFGAMRLKTINGEIDEDKAFELFDYAYKNGVNYFDTAMPYTDGKNETFVGKALKRYKRDSFFLATKLSFGMVKSRDDVLKLIDKQLETLQTDYIDMYLLHALNKERISQIKEWNVLEIVEGWKKEGKIKNIGFSFHDDYDTFVEILNMYEWDFCQIQLNYMDTNFQQGIKGYYDLEKRGIPVVVMEPIKGGKLASFNRDIENIFKNYSDSSIASWALRWVGSLRNVKVILSGMNEMDQLVDNLDTFKNFDILSTEELEKIEQVKYALNNIIAVDCTDCRYCLPCSVGINIPGFFKILNDYKMYENENNSLWQYNNLLSKSSDYKDCIDCGICMEKCPQKIEIPKELARMGEELKFLSK